MGRVKSWVMDQEEKLNEYVWFIVSECETFQEFLFKVKLFAETECSFYNNFNDNHFIIDGLSDVWNDYWSQHSEGK